MFDVRCPYSSLFRSWSQWAPELASPLPMNLFGVPALAGLVRLRERNRLKPGLQTRRGSWLRFTLARGCGLSMNLEIRTLNLEPRTPNGFTPRGSSEFDVRCSLSLLFALPIMVPMGARTGVAPTHELVRSPGFSRSRPAEGAQPAKAGTPNPARFMVTIHARKRVRALHEPRNSNLEPRTSNAERFHAEGVFGIRCSMFAVPTLRSSDHGPNGRQNWRRPYP